MQSELTRPSSSTFQCALKVHSQRIDLETLAKTQPVGNVMTFSKLEEILLDSIEELIVQGVPDPEADPEGFRKRTREMLSSVIKGRGKRRQATAA